MSAGAGAAVSWSIDGADGEPIVGVTHAPREAPIGAVVIAHGFKGYKDYGMFPRVAQAFADAGLVAHRFNFSHSGMTDEIASFARPDLFERDTWNRQVHDLLAVLAAIDRGRIAGGDAPRVLFGHSRGGVSCLLAAGRHAEDAGFAEVAGVISVSAPSTCCPLSAEEQMHLLAAGFLESPSSRTGQVLRVGAGFLREQRADPAAHDLPALLARIRVPVLVIHGADDPTVPSRCAEEIAAKLGRRAELHIVAGADHVFNTPNPLAPDAPASPQLKELLEAAVGFARKVCGEAAKRRSDAGH